MIAQQENGYGQGAEMINSSIYRCGSSLSNNSYHAPNILHQLGMPNVLFGFPPPDGYRQEYLEQNSWAQGPFCYEENGRRLYEKYH